VGLFCVLALVASIPAGAAAQDEKPRVDPAKLAPLLPSALAGFKAGEPVATVAEAEGVHVSMAARRFTKGAGTIDVIIMDGGGDARLFMHTLMDAESVFSTGPQGYERGVTIGGNPGFERYEKPEKKCELTMVVGKRYVVTVRGQNVKPELLKALYKKVGVEQLSALE
jgi:hypothetical protein